MSEEYKLDLILAGIRNLLAQNNENDVNDYLIKKIDREKEAGGIE